MIVVKLQGGLGNQMFEYACGRTLADKTGQKLVLDKSGFRRDTTYGRIYLLNQFDIRYDKTIDKPRQITNYFERVRTLINSPKRLTEPALFSDPSSEETRTASTGGQPRWDISNEVLYPQLRFWQKNLLDGYWQSALYFQDNEDQIRKDFTINEKITHPKKNDLECIAKKTPVCVGIRRYGEANASSHHYTLPAEWYEKAIEHVINRVHDPYFVVVAQNDGQQWARDNLSIAEEAFYVQHLPNNEDAYTDLWLMSHCEHFILANSTYHWWGAFLGKKDGSVITSPSKGWGNIEPHILGSFII